MIPSIFVSHILNFTIAISQTLPLSFLTHPLPIILHLTVYSFSNPFIPLYSPPNLYVSSNHSSPFFDSSLIFFFRNSLSLSIIDLIWF